MAFSSASSDDTAMRLETTARRTSKLTIVLKAMCALPRGISLINSKRRSNASSAPDQALNAWPMAVANSSNFLSLPGSDPMKNADLPTDDTYSEAETIARREAALKRALATPHKSRKPSKAKGKESKAK